MLRFFSFLCWLGCGCGYEFFGLNSKLSEVSGSIVIIELSYTCWVVYTSIVLWKISCGVFIVVIEILFYMICFFLLFM